MREKDKKQDTDLYFNSFYRVNKDLLSLYGAKVTTYLGVLVWHYENMAGKKNPRGDYFYIEYNKMEELTGLYERQQVDLLDILELDFQVIKRKASRIKGAKDIQIDFEKLNMIIKGEVKIEKHLTRLHRQEPKLVGKAKKDHEARLAKEKEKNAEKSKAFNINRSISN